MTDIAGRERIFMDIVDSKRNIEAVQYLTINNMYYLCKMVAVEGNIPHSRIQECIREVVMLGANDNLVNDIKFLMVELLNRRSGNSELIEVAKFDNSTGDVKMIYESWVEVKEACDNPNNIFGDFAEYFLWLDYQYQVDVVFFLQNECNFPEQKLVDIDCVVNFNYKNWCDEEVNKKYEKYLANKDRAEVHGVKVRDVVYPVTQDVGGKYSVKSASIVDRIDNHDDGFWCELTTLEGGFIYVGIEDLHKTYEQALEACIAKNKKDKGK